ncbi:MAG: tetratricopeptide repeat protein [Parachlamydiaceae bacterium]|nr:tetratricopeptide repeat protein [Parachlamydiaceae bacterium]
MKHHAFDDASGCDDFDDLSSLVHSHEGEAHAAEETEKLSAEQIEELYALGHQQYEKGKYEEAIQTFSLLMQQREDDPRHWLGLAASYQMNKEYAAAIIIYAFLTELNPENPFIHFYAAECLFGMGNAENGLKALDECERLAKENEKEFAPLLAQVDLLRTAWKPPAENNATEAGNVTK